MKLPKIGGEKKRIVVAKLPKIGGAKYFTMQVHRFLFSKKEKKKEVHRFLLCASANM